MREVDLSGKIFGSVKVLRKATYMKWVCECPYCHGEFVLWYQALMKPTREKQSCGCRNKHNQTYEDQAATVVWKSNYNDGDIPLDEFIRLSQMNCHYCNRAPANKCDVGKYLGTKPNVNTVFTYNGLDRLDSTLAHTIDNVVPCCKFCNLAKKQMTKAAFLAHIKRIIDNRLAKGR